MNQWQPPDNVPRPYPPPTPTPPAYGPPGYPWSPPPQQPQWQQPAGPPMVWAVLLWGAAAVSIIGVLILGALGAVGFWSDNQMKTHGVTTTATVTDVNRFLDTYTVEFTTEDDRLATAEIVLPSTTRAVGDQVEITYDSEDPSYAIEAGSPEDLIVAVVYTFAAVFALAVAVGAVIGAVLVHRARGKAVRRGAT